MKFIFAVFLFVMASSQASGEAKKLVPGPSPEEKRALEIKKQRIDSIALTELEELVLKRTEDYDILKQYYPHSTDLLFDLLKDPLFAGHWRNIALAIGIVGDLESVNKLKAYLISPFRDDIGLLTEENVKNYAWRGIVEGHQHREVPWLYEFAVTHSTPQDWVSYYGDGSDTQRARRMRASSALRWISRTGTDESIKDVEDIKAKYIASQPLQAKSAKNEGDWYLQVILDIQDDANKLKADVTN